MFFNYKLVQLFYSNALGLFFILRLANSCILKHLPVIFRLGCYINYAFFFNIIPYRLHSWLLSFYLQKEKFIRKEKKNWFLMIISITFYFSFISKLQLVILGKWFKISFKTHLKLHESF